MVVATRVGVLLLCGLELRLEGGVLRLCRLPLRLEQGAQVGQLSRLVLNLLLCRALTNTEGSLAQQVDAALPLTFALDSAG